MGSDRNDIQYFEVIGQMRDDCNRWREEVYEAHKGRLVDFLQQEFGTTVINLVSEFDGSMTVESVAVEPLGTLPPGMRNCSRGWMVPDKTTKKGKEYIEKFKTLNLPPACQPVLDILFGSLEQVFEGPGYWRRPSFFQLGDDWFFRCDVDQAIKMQFASHPDLVPLLPIEMREIELFKQQKEKISDESVS